MSSVQIRKARLEDVAAVKALHKAAIWQLCAADYGEEQLAAWTQWDDTPELPPWTKPDSEEQVWVADLGGVVIGFGSREGDTLTALYVHPDYTRQRVGTRLLRTIEEAARAQDLRQLQFRASLNAAPFYAAAAYHVMGEETYHFPNGVSMACVVMSKQL